jgi:hypothetical protein
VLFVLGRSIALGRRGGLLSVLGNALGMLPAIAAVALGIGALVAQSVVVFTIVKVIGAAYLVFLGIQAIRHRGRGRCRMPRGPAVDLPSPARGLRRRHHEPEDHRVLRRRCCRSSWITRPAASRWQLASSGLVFFGWPSSWTAPGPHRRHAPGLVRASPKRVGTARRRGRRHDDRLGGALLVTGAKELVLRYTRDLDRVVAGRSVREDARDILGLGLTRPAPVAPHAQRCGRRPGHVMRLRHCTQVSIEIASASSASIQGLVDLQLDPRDAGVLVPGDARDQQAVAIPVRDIDARLDLDGAVGPQPRSVQ